jgi:hypothetical protein
MYKCIRSSSQGSSRQNSAAAGERRPEHIHGLPVSNRRTGAGSLFPAAAALLPVVIRGLDRPYRRRGDGRRQRPRQSSSALNPDQSAKFAHNPLNGAMDNAVAHHPGRAHRRIRLSLVMELPVAILLLSDGNAFLQHVLYIYIERVCALRNANCCNMFYTYIYIYILSIALRNANCLLTVSLHELNFIKAQFEIISRLGRFNITCTVY